jgi:DNA replication factor GINS
LVETTLEFVKRHLDSEVQSATLHPLPADFYYRVSQYSQRLRRSAGSGNSEAATRLISRQIEMIESMTRQLLRIRAGKTTTEAAFLQLLSEERFVCSAQRGFQRRFDAFVDALSQGKPSYIEFAHRSESSRNMTVRFVKAINELVGADLRRYGPFKENDVASIPAANAAILISGGEAVEIYTRRQS